MIFERSTPISATKAARAVSAPPGSPLACSSTIRSTRLAAKVTPEALMAWRSRSKEPWPRLVSTLGIAVLEHLFDRPDVLACDPTDILCGIRDIAKSTHGRDVPCDVKNALRPDDDHGRTAAWARDPGPSNPASDVAVCRWLKVLDHGLFS